MIIDLIAQTVPSTWALIAALLIVALVVATYVDPELVEVYLGDAQFVVGMLAVAAVVVALVASTPYDAPRQLGPAPAPVTAAGGP
jgi:hypothetical protein